MTSKMITIRQEVYDRLNRMKKDKESFSDVISRLLDAQKKDPLQHFGIGKDLPEDELDEFERCITIAREQSRNRQIERHEEQWNGNP